MNNSRFFTLLPILLLVFGLKLTAQTDTPYERKIEGAVFDSEDLRDNHVVGYDTNGAFCYQNIKDLPQLVHISHQLATIKTYDIPLKLTNAGREYEFVDWINPVLLGDKICFFYSAALNEKNTIFKLIHTIRISDFAPLNKDVEIPVQNGQLFPFIFGSFQIQNIETSPDHSQLLQFFELSEEKPEETKIRVFRHTNQADKYTETILTLPFEPKLNRIEQAEIDNSGNVYFLVRENFDKARTKYANKNKLPAYQYYIYILPKGSDVPVKKEVNVPGAFISDIKLSVAYNNDLICTGFYSSKELPYSFNGSNALFFIRYSAEKSDIVSQSVNPFGAEFTANNNANTYINNQATPPELKIRQVVNKPDGTSILFTENDFDRLVIIALSQQGEVLWKDCIHTHSCWHFFSKCALLVTEKSIHVLFSDLVKHGQSWSSDEVVLKHYAIDIKSGATKQTVLDSDPKQLSILGGSSGLMSSNELLVYAKSRNPNLHTKQYLLFDFSNR